MISYPGRAASPTRIDRVDPASADRPGAAEPFRELGRALLAIAALLILLVGVPVLLVAVTTAAPIDLSVISRAGLLRSDDGSLVLLAVVAIAWGAWAVMLVSVAIEVWAAVRRVPSPRLIGLGGPQRIAAGLVAAVVVGLAAFGTAAARSPGEVPLDLAASVGQLSAQVATVEPAAPEQALSRGPGGSSVGDDRSRSEEVTVTTVRHDTLWQIAQDRLGSGERFVEIVALNEGVSQPDGRALQADGRLYPGWTLRLPPDADVSSSHGSVHRVERGETLWGIAQEELGDPTRYPEVFDLNEGHPQKDGRALTDPDLILPGWNLELPTMVSAEDEEGSAGSRTAPEPDAGAVAPQLDRVAPSPQAAGPSRTPGPSTVPSVPDLDRGEQSPGQTVGEPNPTEGTASSAPASPPPGSAQVWPRPRPSTAPIPATSPTVDRSPKGAAGAANHGASVPPTPARTESAAVRGSSSAPVPPSPTTPAADVGPTIDRAAALPDSAVVVPAGGVLGVVLLTGAGMELARRRRIFQRYRRPGESLADVSEPERALEALSRVAAGDDSFDLLDRALGQLRENCSEQGITPPPVRVVRVSDADLMIELAEDRSAAVAPFRAISARGWRVDPTLLEGPDTAGGGWPGLVTVGMLGKQTVLVDLPELGTLRVRGDADSVPGVVRAFASELVLGAGAQGASCTLSLTDTRLSAAILAATEAGDIAVEPDPVQVAAGLATVLDRPDPMARDDDPVELVLADQPLPVEVPGRRRVGLITTDPDACSGGELVLRCDGSAELLPDGIRLIPQSLASGASTALLGLLQATEVPSDPDVDPDSQDSPGPGAAGDHSEPDPACSDPADTGGDTSRCLAPGLILADPGVDLTAAAGGVPQPVTLDLTDSGLAARGGAPAGASRVGAGRTSSTLPVGQFTGAVRVPMARVAPAPLARHPSVAPAPTVGSQGPRDEPRLFEIQAARCVGEPRAPEVGSRDVAVPEILMLGEVRVRHAHGRAESTRIGRLAETAAFVLLNPDSRPSALQSALWPGRRSNPATCRQMISRTRTWLGRHDDGLPYLLQLADNDGRLRLRPEVGSDWARFQNLAATGLADPDDTATLTEALGLVRGRPFGPVTSRELPWADLVVNDMICLITDVAHELALRHEAAGRWAAARGAALRGLRTESESAVLAEVLARLGHRA